MDGRLTVQIDIDTACNVYAIDKSDYDSFGEDINNHVMLDFWTDREDNIIYKNWHTIPNESVDLTTVITLPSDGTFSYYKLILPCLQHFAKLKTDGSQTVEKYEVANKYFYHNGVFYYSLTDIESLEELRFVNQITDVFDIWENREEQDFFWYNECIFSICRLEKCLLSLQKRTIEKCFTRKCKDLTDDKYKRDFILDSVFVLKYLISMKNYTEAQRILDNLSLCGDICGEEFALQSKGGCNCGSAF